MHYFGGGIADYERIRHEISYVNLQMLMAAIPRIDTKPPPAEGSTSVEDIQSAASEEAEEIGVEDLMGMFGG